MSQTLAIADDDPVVQHILQSILESLGFEVVVWGDGSTAEANIISLAQTNNLPAVIFLDMFLGDMTGTELYAKLLELKGDQSVHAVLLTANKLEEMKDYGDAELPEHYLRKPFTMDDVSDLIEKLGLNS